MPKSDIINKSGIGNMLFIISKIITSVKYTVNLNSNHSFIGFFVNISQRLFIMKIVIFKVDIFRRFIGYVCKRIFL